MYQTGGTIKETLDQIERREFVLPAIQREFVWQPEQIIQLFDSLMQGYPFGTFLYWRVEPQNSSKYKFYDFVRDYHERDNPHCPALPDLHDRSLIAVLDGQQRLTALNIGFRGSMARKLPNKWWTNPDAFPVKRLYLDLLASPPDDETGERYKFDFLVPERANISDSTHCWFQVSKILSMHSGPEMLTWLTDRLPNEQLNQAYATLDQLYQVIYHRNVVVYYEEKSQDLSRVLNVFIRTNSGGTILSYSDLLLSVAVAQWNRLDAREEIHSLIDEMNRTGGGFNFSKDLALKAGLMLSDIGSVGFKVENFNRQNMEILEEQWASIRAALILTVRLLSSFGFTGPTLRADSAILPIAYYLHFSKRTENYLTHSRHQEDRESIREWLIRSLLKASGIWGSGLDTLLTALREEIRNHGSDQFPVANLREIMARRGKSLTFEAEEIEELVEMKYGDKRVFPLLYLLFPFIDLRYHFHIDHIFPKGRFTYAKLRQAGVPNEKMELLMEKCDQLPNLQLLEGAYNNEKRQKMPAEWLESSKPDPSKRQSYLENHLLGEIPKSMVDFESFFDSRRMRLLARIKQVLKSAGSG